MLVERLLDRTVLPPYTAAAITYGVICRLPLSSNYHHQQQYLNSFSLKIMPGMYLDVGPRNYFIQTTSLDLAYTCQFHARLYL